jgi:hypothetical protein
MACQRWSVQEISRKLKFFSGRAKAARVHRLRRLSLPYPQSPPLVEGEAVLFIFLNMKEGLRDTKLLYRELGNRFGVFNASLADLEYLLGDDPGEGIVTFFKT